MKPLPIGISTFEEIIRKGYIYVDKTQYLYNMITTSKYIFLSRPRRFGKSLTLSTLKAIFSGKRELFDGLALIATAYSWPIHPIIHIDLSGKQDHSVDDLRQTLVKNLRDIGREFGIALQDNYPPEYLLEDLVKALAHNAPPVVLLIDEYDKPITDHIDNPKLANQMRDALSSFYGVIKKLDSYLEFVFITGVSKFTKTSLFSTLNNLKDISLHKDYTALLGYTEEELTTHFYERIDAFAQTLQISRDEMRRLLRSWYNGYLFSRSGSTVYSPQTIMNALDQQELKNFWFETGSPAFLMKLVKSYDYPIIFLDQAQISESELSPNDIKQLRLEAILLQTGYLTIKSYDCESQNYTLIYPNREVMESFLRHTVQEISHTPLSEVNILIKRLLHAIESNEIESFLTMIYTFMAGVPYTLHLGLERFYQSVMYTLLKLVGADVAVEDATNKGRIDATIITATHVYIIELKSQESAVKALAQIIDRKYEEKFQNSGKTIVLIGLSFDPKEKNFSRQWEIQKR